MGYEERRIPDKTYDLVIYMDSFSLDDNFEMRNVFYDFNKATLRPESGAELEKLITLMNENPSIDVQIRSHTDSVGSAEYNDRLSNDRAQSVVDYLVSAGIDRSRLSTLGLGKSSPAVDNSTDENRQKNRRTEFRIVADHPTRRIVFNSALKGNLGEQSKLNLGDEDQVDNNPDIPEEDMEIIHEDAPNPSN
ncbi:MAG: OmpA family protein [Taibaiella sp.]|nr:OmpA family protein [Taibaiella sp.]